MVRRRDIFVGAGTAGLLALPGDTRRVTAGLMPLIKVATLVELRATSPAVGTVLYNGSVFRWSPGDYSRPPLGPADDHMIVQQSGTPSAEGAWIKQSGVISVAAFGARPGDEAAAASNGSAFRDAIGAAAAVGLPLTLDGASYVLNASDGINFAREGLRIVGGGSTLRFVGRGRAFVLDHGGADGQYLEAMMVEDLTIVGGPGITDGFYSRGVVRSSFRNIEVRTVSGKAFHLRHAVSNHYDGLKYSPPSAAPVKATHGLYADSNGAGNFTANCVFTNTVMEDFPGIGCQLADSSGLVFTGGTFEGCETGLVIAPPSDNNLFIQLWAEANRTSDVIVSGNGNGFIGGKFISAGMAPNVRILDNAHGTWFSGGYSRSIHIAQGAKGTSFMQVGVDENRSGTIGFQGDGAFTRIGCTKVDATNTVVGQYDDRLGSIGTLGNSGQWRPILRSTRGLISTQADLTRGSYQKLGNLVFAQCFLYVAGTQAADGELFVDGLPFVSALRQPGAVHATRLDASAHGALQVRVDPGERRIFVSLLADGSAQPCARHLRSETTLSISLTYLVLD